MALTYNTLNALMNNFPDIIQSNIVENYPLWKYLTQHKIGQTSGSQIQVYTTYGTPSITAWDGHSTISSATTETSTKAIYSWAHAYISETINYNDWLDAATAGKHAIAGLAKEKAKAIERGFGLGLETHLFHIYDGTSYTFNGIPDIINSADPTNQATGLGGIAVADASWWAANTLAYNSTNTLRWHMQKMLRMLSVPPFGKPDLILTSGDVIDQYGGEIEDKVGILPTNKGLKWGFENIVPFAGIPVVWSPDCTANTMYFLNSKFLSLEVHPNDFIKIRPWEKTSTTNLNLITTATLTAQLIASSRYAMGYITGIS